MEVSGLVSKVGTEIPSLFTRNKETLGKLSRFSQLHKMGNSIHVSAMLFKMFSFQQKLQDMQKKCEKYDSYTGVRGK